MIKVQAYAGTPARNAVNTAFDPVTVTVPAAAVGEMSVLYCTAFGSGTTDFKPLTGWSVLTPATHGADNPGDAGDAVTKYVHASFYRVRQVGDPTTVQVGVTVAGASPSAAVLVLPVRLINVAPVSPFENTDVVSVLKVPTGTGQVAPSVDATDARFLMCLYGISSNTNDAQFPNPSWNPATTLTELMDAHTTFASRIVSMVAFEDLTATGATGTRTSWPSVSSIGGAAASILVTAAPDPEKPDAPGNLQLLTGNAELTASWATPVSNGGSPILRYDVTAVPSAGTTVTMQVSLGTNTAKLTGLVNNITYAVSVTATNIAGTSDVATAYGTPVAAPTAPLPPASVTATGGNAQIVVSWPPSPGDGGSPLIEYIATLTGGAGAPVVQTVPADTLTTTFSGLVNGTEYTVTVAARNTVGTSAGRAAPPATPYMLPSSPTAVAATVGDGSITATWGPPATAGTGGVTGYRVAAFDQSTGTQAATTDVGATVRTATLAGLANGTSYRVEIRALSAYGASGPATLTAIPTVPPARPPDPPTNLTAADVATLSGAVELHWGAPASDGGSALTGYDLIVKDPATGAEVQHKTYPAGTTTDQVTGLSDGTTYTFNLAAVNAVGTGVAATATAAPHPIATAPSQVRNLTGVALDEHTARLAWTPPVAGASPTSYEVSTLPPSRTIVVPSTQTGTDVIGLTPDTEYTFQVRALNLYGASAPANVTVITPAAYLAPELTLPEPVPYAFPQPTDVDPPRVFRPANFGKTIEEVPVGE